MPALQGTLLASGIVPTDSQDTFATHSERYGAGGYRSVSSLAERDAITPERRIQGMLVFVIAENTTYRLTTGVTNLDWENLGNGSAAINKRKILFTDTDLIIVPDVEDYSIIEVWVSSNIYRPALWNTVQFNTATFDQTTSEGAQLYRDYTVKYDVGNKELLIQLLTNTSGVVILY